MKYLKIYLATLAELDHLPRALMSPSPRSHAAAVVAAPILNECPLYPEESMPDFPRTRRILRINCCFVISFMMLVMKRALGSGGRTAKYCNTAVTGQMF